LAIVVYPKYRIKIRKKWRCQRVFGSHNWKNKHSQYNDLKNKQ